MGKVTRSFKKRCISVLALIIVGGFALDIFRLFWFQVIKSDEQKLEAEKNQMSDYLVSANRGTIYDASMNILAESAAAWRIFIDPTGLSKDKETAAKEKKLVAKCLSTMLEGVKKKDILDKLEQKGDSYIVIKEKITYEIKSKIVEFRDDNFLGNIIGVEDDTKRYYPFGNFASTVIGMTSNENKGRAGIELEYDETLTGTPGRIVAALDARSGPMVGAYETRYEAQEGNGLVLTIDKSIQHYLEKGLSQAVKDNDANSAYGIVMDVKTGAVLAMATMPDYNLNNPSVITDPDILKELKEIKDDEKYSEAYNNAVFTSWRNRAISDTYEPGSVFKIFTGAAGIEEGVADINSTFTCTGSIQVADNLIRCHDHAGHGTQTLTQGLMNSCNPFFITIGQKLGTEKFYKYFEAFGFSAETNIDLPAEATPVAGVTYHSKDNMGISQLSSCSFGQTFQVSAIQMVTAVSAIANGGKLMEPYVISKKLDHNGNTLYEASPEVKRQVVSESTSKTVLSMMEQVVANGTGRNAYIPGYRVAGKTGTSEKLAVDYEAYIASFVGCAPADDPKITVLIVIDEPKGAVHGGGAIAAPVAGSVIEQTLQYMNVEPVYTDEELAKLNITTPSVSGMSVSAARQAIESQGFTARVVGDGDKVISQSPVGGKNIQMNGVMVLYTEAGKGETQAKVPELTGLSISQANERAVNSGFNIKISGAAVNSEVVSYRQSSQPGDKLNLGSTITVYFKTTSGVQDD